MTLAEQINIARTQYNKSSRLNPLRGIYWMQLCRLVERRFRQQTNKASAATSPRTADAAPGPMPHTSLGRV